MMDNGIDVKRDTPILEARAAELEQLRQQKADFEGMLRGETKQQALDRAARQIELTKQQRERQPYNPDTPLIPEDVVSREAEIARQDSLKEVARLDSIAVVEKAKADSIAAAIAAAADTLVQTVEQAAATVK